MNWSKDNYTLTDEPAGFDFEITCALLHSTYWAADRSCQTIARSLQHSLNFGLFHGPEQVGFARVVTDRATVAYLCDVVIADEHRGRGIGRWMIQCILDHPELQHCRIDLFTKDAQEFYRPFGFGPHPYTNMVRYPPGDPRGASSTSSMAS